MMRAVGANAWRMSHNPPSPVMLDILDNIGVVARVWDENRNFGPNPEWVQAQRDMVRRDHNHPSIMVWSLCNKHGCGTGDNGDTAENFTAVSKEGDPFRPVTGNQFPNQAGGPLSQIVDVQRFSHQEGSQFDGFHQKYPNKPIIGLECCSCSTQTGEDYGDSSNRISSNFNANCNRYQTGSELKWCRLYSVDSV